MPKIQHEKRVVELMYGDTKKRKKMETVVSGKGDPPIVLLSDCGMDLHSSWAKVFTPLQDHCRVLAYDRWNAGKSESTTVPQNGKEIIRVLRGLLSISELALPCVLVGHGMGGLYAQLFARLHPEEVAGVVLIDSSTPDQNPNADFLKRTMDALNPRRNSEMACFPETAQQLRAAPGFPSIPLVVVGTQRQDELVGLSPQGRQIVLQQSGHCVQNDEPQVVIDAVREVVAAARDNSQRHVPTKRVIEKSHI